MAIGADSRQTIRHCGSSHPPSSCMVPTTATAAGSTDAAAPCDAGVTTNSSRQPFVAATVILRLVSLLIPVTAALRLRPHVCRHTSHAMGDDKRPIT
eukprot:356295-Chlamydomonas_euryale.AAC.16